MVDYDERATAYINIKIWLEQALASDAKGWSVKDDLQKIIHHLPIIDPRNK